MLKRLAIAISLIGACAVVSMPQTRQDMFVYQNNYRRRVRASETDRATGPRALHDHVHKR